jgi:hypothetical protein
MKNKQWKRIVYEGWAVVCTENKMTRLWSDMGTGAVALYLDKEAAKFMCIKHNREFSAKCGSVIPIKIVVTLRKEKT